MYATVPLGIAIALLRAIGRKRATEHQPALLLLSRSSNLDDERVLSCHGGSNRQPNLLEARRRGSKRTGSAG